MSGLRVFLCYASDDRLQVRDLCRRLREDGFEPWLDEEKLLPGQDWELEISAAVEASDAVIVCLSPASVNKVGYVQKELRRVLDIADRQPEGRIFVIPVRLEECPVPTRLSRWQYADLFVEGGYQRLCVALRSRAEGAAGASIPSPPRQTVERHLTSGDRFAEQGQYDAANQEFEKILAIDRDNLDAHRRIVRVACRQFTLKAFTPGHPVFDIGLRRDYTNFAFVSDDEINTALTHVYDLEALNPQFKDDVDLQLDAALILKTNGGRVGAAIKVLERAHQFDPENPGVNAELGLMLAVLEESQRKAEGITLIRRAVQNHPDEARYHFYLARALAEVYACPYAGLENSDANGPHACAEAIREYHRAADLATGRDTWSWAIRVWAQKHSMEIFHRYARKEGDILTPELAMSPEERLKELEYLIPTGASKFCSGANDDPNFWIPQLEYATGNMDKAEQHIRDFMQKDHDEWLGTHQQYWEDAYYIQSRAPYAEFFVKVLKKTGRDPQTLAKVQSILQLPAKPD